ncbi:uncharacterized protein LOC132705236 isoform X2 [Cylas formicarius]|uniref:uncharacterized protein LOC132705236 isoform X2 n=1 Tax=Cylas formicarius TaxID=197179 RepID=UPI002958D3B9|nr:uncharacterized protein LOC132705236 isoform X2 [Cylas formicarius]
MYPIKKGAALYYVLTMFNCLSYYPTEKEKKAKFKFYAVSSCIRILTAVMWVGSIVHFCVSLKNGVYALIVEDLIFVTGVSTSMITCLLFWINHDNWSNVFLDVTNCQNFGKPSGFDDRIKALNSMSLYGFIYCCSGIFVYMTFKLTDEECENLNQKQGLSEICNLVAPLWLPSSVTITRVKKFVIIGVQILCSLYYIPTSATISFMIWVTSEILHIRILHLKELIKVTFDGDEATAKRRLRFCVRYHVEIIRICYNFQRSMYATVGHVASSSGLVLACLGNQLLKTHNFGILILMVGWMVGLFILCYIGQDIKILTLSIGDAFLESNWFKGDTKDKKILQIALMRTQKPILVKTFLSGVYGYELYFMIVKASYSYLTLIYRST